MRHTILNKVMMAAALLGVGILGAATTNTAGYSDADIAKKLIHEIRTYPRITMFDDVNLRVNEGRVELLGDVTQPFKKADLGRIAQRVPGVTSVANDINVLPLSPMDNRLRLQVARAIFRDPIFTQYRLQAISPIHIIVDNGHVTLEGVVRTQMEKNVAGIRAGSTMTFGPVVNNLRVEQPNHKS